MCYKAEDEQVDTGTDAPAQEDKDGEQRGRRDDGAAPATARFHDARGAGAGACRTASQR